MKICAIIPTYNEAATLGNLIKDLRQLNLPVCVVDDGSADNSAEIARQAGAEVLRNETNQGKGAALIQGFHYALIKGYDAAITMDGDGQHLASDIPRFLGVAADPHTGIIIGNRMDQVKNMPWIRVLTNRFMSWLISRLCRQAIPDSQCGFRLIKKEVLEKVRLSTRKFETESEILIETARLGLRIRSVPIKTIYRNEVSYVNPISDTLRFIRFIARCK